MGAEDVRRQALNVFRIKLLGATVVAVEAGAQTLRDAVNEALRAWVVDLDTTHYIIGSAIGPHPFPTIVRTFQSVIGSETKVQMQELEGKLPDAVVACVGGGSNAVGMFYPFTSNPGVKLLGVEAGGDGLDTDRHSATLTGGSKGVLHGVRTYILQNAHGQISETHSVSAGLDYPGVGPELSSWKDNERARFIAATDANAFEGFRLLSELEGIIPALETAHAVWGALGLAKELGKGKDVVICLSGRGDKDVQSVAEELPRIGPDIGWDLRCKLHKSLLPWSSHRCVLPIKQVANLVKQSEAFFESPRDYSEASSSNTKLKLNTWHSSIRGIPADRTKKYKSARQEQGTACVISQQRPCARQDNGSRKIQALRNYLEAARLFNGLSTAEWQATAQCCSWILDMRASGN